VDVDTVGRLQTGKLSGKALKDVTQVIAENPTFNERNKYLDAFIFALDTDRVYGDMLTRNDIKSYLDKVFSDFKEGDFIFALENFYGYKQKIITKINELMKNYRKKQFKNLLKSDDVFLSENYKFPHSISPLKTNLPFKKSLYEKEDAVNNFELDIITSVDSLSNVVFWHRNIERTGFFLNGFINHYPDFIIYTEKENVILLETKGDDRDNSDSADKLELGNIFENKSTGKHKYFMVFENNAIDGAYNKTDFIELLERF
jgi:type III restriction enzyme